MFLLLEITWAFCFAFRVLWFFCSTPHSPYSILFHCQILCFTFLSWTTLEWESSHICQDNSSGSSLPHANTSFHSQFFLYLSCGGRFPPLKSHHFSHPAQSYLPKMSHKTHWKYHLCKAARFHRWGGNSQVHSGSIWIFSVTLPATLLFLGTSSFSLKQTVLLLL